MIDSFSGNYRFLSNFYPVTVEYEGMLYPTVEHAYQAAKTLNTEHQAAIARASSPAIAKRLGRSIVLRKDWEKIKIGVMRQLLRQKFSKPALAAKLLATDNVVLVEGNTWNDTFWGKCNSKGANNLGLLLMDTRTKLRRLVRSLKEENAN